MAFLRGGREAGGGASFWRALKQSYQFLRRHAWSTFKYRNVLGLDFTALTHLYFSVVLYMCILALKHLLFGFYKVIGKILIDCFLMNMERSIYQVSLLVCNISVPFSCIYEYVFRLSVHFGNRFALKMNRFFSKRSF